MSNAEYSRQLLSGSTNGRPIAVAATSSPGTTIHTATNTANAFDEAYLWATNTDTVDRTLSIQWGGTGTSDYVCKDIVIPANSGPTLVVAGEVLNGGLVVKAYASVTNVINLSGYVNRITPT